MSQSVAEPSHLHYTASPHSKQKHHPHHPPTGELELLYEKHCLSPFNPGQHRVMCVTPVNYLYTRRRHIPDHFLFPVGHEGNCSLILCLYEMNMVFVIRNTASHLIIKGGNQNYFMIVKCSFQACFKSVTVVVRFRHQVETQAYFRVKQ